MQYMVTKRFKKKGLCGELNLPVGTKCFVKEGYICCEKGLICSVKSQNAYEFFTQNNDEHAALRRKLINDIFHALKRSKQNIDSYDTKWNKIWNDRVCLKYKREEYDDYWIWNHEFYHAEISDLMHMKELVHI